jgi:hypothetical protein
MGVLESFTRLAGLYTDFCEPHKKVLEVWPFWRLEETVSNIAD